MADEILRVLQATLEPATVQQATKQLQAWSHEPAFLMTLLRIVAVKEEGQVSTALRLQAAVLFKNQLDRWRKTNPKALPEDAKTAMRPMLLSLLSESNQAIAANIAVAVGKIGRIDYNVDWPSLPEELLTLIGTSYMSEPRNLVAAHRGLLAMKEVVNLLIQNRMPKGRRLVMQFRAVTFDSLASLYDQAYKTSTSLLQSTDLNPAETIFQLEICIAALKVLRELFAFGFSESEKDSGSATTFFATVLQRARELQQLRLNIVNMPEAEPRRHPRILELLTKHLLGLGKHCIEEGRRTSIAQAVFGLYWEILQGSAGYVNSASVAEEMDENCRPYPSQLTVQSLTVIRKIISFWPSSEHAPLKVTDADTQLLETLKGWSVECSRLLLLHFIPMTSDDIEEWQHEPEVWMNSEESESDTFEIRPAAIRLQTDLVNQFMSVVGPPIVALLSSDDFAVPTTRRNILIKEGIYAFMCRRPSDLSVYLEQWLPFDTWLTQHLIPEVTSTNPDFNFLRRRVLWLIGAFLAVTTSPAAKDRIYQTLLNILNHRIPCDFGAKLTAARAIAACDDWSFDQEQFAPYLQESLKCVCQLIHQVDTPECKIRLVNVISNLVEKMDRGIIPFIDSLMSMVPMIWAAAGDDQPLLKIAVLEMLTKLSDSIGSRSETLHGPLCGFIAYAVDPKNTDYTYLHEEGIELWRSLIRWTEHLTPELIALLPQLVQMLIDTTDIVRFALNILEGYCFLDAAVVLSQHGAAMFSAIAEMLIAQLEHDRIKPILHALNTLIILAPVEAWQPLMQQSRTFTKLLNGIRGDEQTLTLAKYIGSLSRIAVSNPAAFILLSADSARLLGVEEGVLLQETIHTFVQYHDNIGSARHRKLLALSLAFLTSTSKKQILEMLPHVVPIWLSAMAETEETEEGDASAYSIMDAYDSEPEFDGIESPDSQRRLNIKENDPVHTLKLTAVVSAGLEAAQQASGGPQAFQATYLAGIDPLLLDELSGRLAGQLKG